MSVIRAVSHQCAGKLRAAITLPLRKMSIHDTKKFKRLKEMQATMQCDDNVPVYLKRGTRDKILFGVTCTLMAYGFVDMARFVWRRA